MVNCPRRGWDGLMPVALRYNEIVLIGEWRSLVARCVRDAEVPGSNPGSPTNLTSMRKARLRRVVSRVGRGVISALV